MNFYAGAFLLVWGKPDTKEQQKLSDELRERIYQIVLGTPLEHRNAAYPVVVNVATQSCAVAAAN